MTTEEETREQLVEELDSLRARLAALQQAEAERNRTEEVLRGLEKGLHTMQLGVTITDVEGRIIFANASEARLHNRSVDELVGSDVGIYAPPERRRPLTLEQLKELASWKRESVNVRKDGSVFPVLLRSDVVTGASGEPMGIVTTCEDISELRAVEEALRRSEAEHAAFVEHATYGICRSSMEGKFLTVNLALVKMLGYQSSADLLAVDPASNVYADPDEFARLIDQFRQSNRVERMEVGWKTQDGNPITVRLSGRAVPDDRGKPQSFEFIAEDVTEQRALEAQLRHAQKMEAIGQLTGGIAHDFNNILTVIQANAGLMASDLPPEAEDSFRDELRETQHAVRRGTALIKKLLAFSRREPLSVEPLDLAQLAAGLSEALRRLLPESIEIQVLANEPAGTVRADQNAVEQILVNLATNARDAMPGGGLLCIETRPASIDREHRVAYGWGDPGQYVCVSVSDTGVGMDERTKEKVFEPFFTTKPPGEGTGLGMAMIYGLVKQHGGFVHLYSEVGEGTTVKVYFPLAHEKAAAPAAGQEVEELRGGTETILVVEDEAQVRTAAKRVLERYGYTILVAEDGEEAFRMFRAHQPEIDLVVTDVVMPGLSGPQLYLAIRAESKSVGFVFMSGHSAGRVRTSGGFDPTVPFLYKPWTVAELVVQVRRTLDQGPNVPGSEGLERTLG